MNPDYLQQSLGGYDRTIAGAFSRMDEIERRLRNLNIAGRVSEIHPSGKLIKVSYGNRNTDWIIWFATAAGDIADYRCPSLGEQCLLLNYGGGLDSSQVWALCGVPSDQFPLPGDGDPAKRVTAYASGVVETIENSGKVTLKAVTKVDVDTPELHGTGEVSDKKRTMTADRAIFDGHKHLEKGDGALTDEPNNKQG